MARYESGQQPGRLWLRTAVGLVVLLAFALPLMACTSTGTTEPAATDSGPEFDPSSMTWNPGALAQAAPCLVGWRTGGEGVPGALTVLSGASDGDPVIWRAPVEPDLAYLQLIEIDPRGHRMIGALFTQERGAEPRTRTLLFAADGSVSDLPHPEGFEGIADVAFTDDGILAVAYHATVDDFRTTVGLVSPDGGWTPLVVEGDLPEYQFIEAVLTRAGSEMVGLVLKIPGGTGDRDDDLLVLARRSGSRLGVETSPYYDDSLPGAQSLWSADGVVFPRMWSMTDGESTPTLVRVEWIGSEWVESELAEPGSVPVGLDGGGVVISDAAGGYWLREIGDDPHGAGSKLLYLARGEMTPRATGTDISDVDWFAWVEGEAR
ncbi:MAG: hypothetical protein U1E29_06655 [Coriobacteriia bacterium]|nr:hypothetical protein [Coriobacteriia bacterium]